MQARSPAIVLVALALLSVPAVAPRASAWSNGGFSADPAHPDYGTHDWIAEHALAWLPAGEKGYIEANLAAYLYGTELPDNGGAPDGIGDTALHHVYFRASGALQDDAAAARASEEFGVALAYLRASEPAAAAKVAGILTHYVSDVAVFGHVMGASTDWGAEVHHQDYEDYVTARMTSYTSAMFDPALVFDGALEDVGAYEATLRVAWNTTFGDGAATEPCAWMDAHYDWADPAFLGSARGSLDRAVNAVADVLHTLALDAASPAPDTSSPTVAIASPAEGAALAAGTVAVRGTASDDVGVARVQVSADGTAWTDASGTTAWSASLAVGAGTTRIFAAATDTSGNARVVWVNVTVSAPATQTGGVDPLVVAVAAVLAAAVAVPLAGVGVRRRRRRAG